MSTARGGARGIPTSRAYWDLQAEKLLNGVFDLREAIDLDPLQAQAPTGAESDPSACDAAGETITGENAQAAADHADPGPAAAPSPAGNSEPVAAAATPPAAAAIPAAAIEAETPPVSEAATTPPQPVTRPKRPRRPAAASPGASSREPASNGSSRQRTPPGLSLPQPLLLVAVFAGAGLITATSGVLALSQWNRFQESLQQERNLLLVERLRSFGPAVQPVQPTPPAPVLAPPVAATPSGGPATDGGLPPPPPSEPWIDDLGALPQQQRPAQPLRVPVSPALAAATPPPPVRRQAPAGPVPLLVGVVAVPGKPGSAIFQMGGTTSTVAVGESIGASGWRLIASQGDSVQIENQGEVRRISIGGGG